MNDGLEILEEIKEYINKHYKASCCSWTSENSEGNSDDIFNDGQQYGKAWVLYSIGKIIGMKLEEPEEN